MVTEYIKRNQKMGYQDGVLVYKIPASEAPPVIEEAAVEELPPVIDEETPFDIVPE